jgi:alanine dehydrogenase
VHGRAAGLRTTSIAYETVQTPTALPLLALSEVAGRLSAQVGAYHLMRTQGGAVC